DILPLLPFPPRRSSDLFNAMPGGRSSSRPRVWLDADPGHDDVFAILVALDRADLLGVSVVSGNAPLAACLKNTLVTLQLADAERSEEHTSELQSRENLV